MDFHERCPELAERETRSIFAGPRGILPPDEYGFVEYYCANPACDCRQVLIVVLARNSPDTPAAFIRYGWESEEFYRRWFEERPEEEAAELFRELTTATLDSIASQSSFAGYLLNQFQGMIANESEFAARFERHYRAFRATLKSKNPQGADRRPPKRRRK